MWRYYANSVRAQHSRHRYVSLALISINIDCVVSLMSFEYVSFHSAVFELGMIGCESKPFMAVFPAIHIPVSISVHCILSFL